MDAIPQLRYELKLRRGQVWDHRMEENFDAAIKMLNRQGHTVRPYIRQGRLWFEPQDGTLPVSSWITETDLPRIPSTNLASEFTVMRKAPSILPGRKPGSQFGAPVGLRGSPKDFA